MSYEKRDVYCMSYEKRIVYCMSYKKRDVYCMSHEKRDVYCASNVGPDAVLKCPLGIFVGIRVILKQRCLLFQKCES